MNQTGISKTKMSHTARLLASSLSLGVALILLTASAQANLAVNGNFQSTQIAGSSEFGSRFPQQQVTGWATDGYNFVFTSGTGDSSGANSEYGNVQLWGPNNGSANGFPSASPDGGNYLAMDGAYATAPVTQMINGLTPGHSATVSFYWAGIQQYTFTGPTTEQFQVTLGTQSMFTSVVSLPSHGFSGWQSQSFTFTPTSASEVLSFLAVGTPNGLPPFSLLDGVSVSATPEPGTWGMIVAGGNLLAIAVWKRRRSSGAPAIETKS